MLGLSPTEIDYLEWLDDQQPTRDIYWLRQKTWRDRQWGIWGLEDKEAIEVLRRDTEIITKEYQAEPALQNKLLILECSEYRAKRNRLKGLIAMNQRTIEYSGGYDKSQINAARDYPIEDLLCVKRGSMVQCPECEGDRFMVKGFGFCFSQCHKRISSLDYLMRFKGMEFREAVGKLIGVIK